MLIHRMACIGMSLLTLTRPIGPVPHVGADPGTSAKWAAPARTDQPDIAYPEDRSTSLLLPSIIELARSLADVPRDATLRPRAPPTPPSSSSKPTETEPRAFALANAAQASDAVVGAVPVVRLWRTSAGWAGTISPPINTVPLDGRRVMLGILRFELDADGTTLSASHIDNGISVTGLRASKPPSDSHGARRMASAASGLDFYCYYSVVQPEVRFFGTFVMHAEDSQACNLVGPSIDTMELSRFPGGVAGHSTTGGSRWASAYGWVWTNQTNRAVVGYDDDLIWYGRQDGWSGAPGTSVAGAHISPTEVAALRPS